MINKAYIHRNNRLGARLRPGPSSLSFFFRLLRYLRYLRFLRMAAASSNIAGNIAGAEHGRWRAVSAVWEPGKSNPGRHPSVPGINLSCARGDKLFVWRAWRPGPLALHAQRQSHCPAFVTSLESNKAGLVQWAERFGIRTKASQHGGLGSAVQTQVRTLELTARHTRGSRAQPKPNFPLVLS